MDPIIHLDITPYSESFLNMVNSSKDVLRLVYSFGVRKETEIFIFNVTLN